MDIAGFVGFAASGPINVPVPVEDAAQFARIFGANAPLAWDVKHGEQAYAFLGPAVRAFFRNGGRRCWVVRVADTNDAKANVFPLPGLGAIDAQSGKVAPAVIRARSEGSWSDGLRVSCSLEPTPVRLQARSVTPPVFDGLVAASGDLVPGDLVRISFAGSPWMLLFVVRSVDAAAASPPAEPAGDPLLQAVTVQGEQPWWVRLTTVAAGRHGHLHYLGTHGVMHTAAAVVADAVPGDEGLLRVSVDTDPATAPQPGSLVRGVFSTRSVWIDVTDVDVAGDGSTAVVGTPFQVTTSAPASTPRQAPDALAERLTLRLLVEDDAGTAWVLPGLGFAPAHPRFLGALPTDRALYLDPDSPDAEPPAPTEPAASPADLSSPPAVGTLAAAAAEPRFPLAGPAEAPLVYLPLGATILTGPALPATRPEGLNRLRDGLQQIGPALFLDQDLATVEADRLLGESTWIHDQQPNPRNLRGIHALLAVDEVTIVVVPDAVQREWYLYPGAHIPDAPSPAPTVEPDWSRFTDCETRVPMTPATFEKSGDEETGTFTLSWSPTDVEGAAYELQETSDPGDESAAETLYSGPEHRFSVYGRPRGSTLYYRVRAVAAGQASGWTEWIPVRTTQTTRWVLDDPSLYSAAATLLPVQLAVLRMCAARGDLFSVIALPEHYRERAAIAHVQALKSWSGRPPGSEPDPIFSYGACYHPWLFTSDPTNPSVIRRSPPDGAAAGIIAQRSSRRGAWIAPANEPLKDVLQLDPPLGADWYQALQDAQVNVVRHDPSGFLWLAADTLSDDADLRPIGVRRLLQTIRRAALLYGARYAFEPNSDVFRRAVQRGFQQLLARAYALGAFAGATASDAYRVNTGSPPNTPQSLDAGRLIVELQVAPSRPLAFLTVRLVRTGEGSLQVEAR